jgi:hypothetical protein
MLIQTEEKPVTLTRVIAALAAVVNVTVSKDKASSNFLILNSLKTP